ncbi:MAG: hypothetical protein KKF56_04185 [Nanoarchaeota archaeon]|nr:hypothetical protein [Nanoarchaeota archaeon]
MGDIITEFCPGFGSAVRAIYEGPRTVEPFEGEPVRRITMLFPYTVTDESGNTKIRAMREFVSTQALIGGDSIPERGSLSNVTVHFPEGSDAYRKLQKAGLVKKSKDVG